MLVRLLTATRPHQPQVATLDRSAYLILHEVLTEKEPFAVQQLALRLNVDLSTMSRQVATMESKGLLNPMQVTDDARSHRVQATPTGRQQFESMRDARRQVYGQILHEWSPQDQEQLAQVLQRFTDSIRQYQNRMHPHDRPQSPPKASPK